MVRASVRLSEGYVVQFPLGLRHFLSIGLIRIHTKSYIPQAATKTYIYIYICFIYTYIFGRNISKSKNDAEKLYTWSSLYCLHVSMVLLTCLFHFKSLVTIIPRTFADFTISNGFPFIFRGSSANGCVVKSILSFLHLPGFS